MTRIFVVMILTALAIFGQDVASTAEKPPKDSFIHENMSIEEGEWLLATLQNILEAGTLKHFEQTNRAVSSETDILRTIVSGRVIEPNANIISLQYVRVHSLDEQREHAANKMSGELSQIHDGYYTIRRFLTPESVPTWDSKNHEKFESWYEGMLARRIIDHDGFDSVMLAAAKLLPPGTKRDIQVRRWEDHGTKPHYIKCGVINCSDPISPDDLTLP